MRVTVVVRRRARPGEGAHLIAAAVHLLEARLTQATPLSVARLFQSLSTPDDVLFVSVWDTRAAYWASLQDNGAEQQLDALCVGEPGRCFFRQLALEEDAERPVVVVDCAILQSPPADAEALLSALLHAGQPLTEIAPGFTLYYLVQDQATFAGME